LLLRTRPAPLGSALARLTRMDRRRMVSTRFGSFFVNRVSQIGFHIATGEYEPRMRSVLERYLPPGGVFIDLGANEGYFSVIASKLVGDKGSVIAVEPQSRLQNVILTNLAANDCFNVRLFKCLLTDKTGTTSMFLSSPVNTGSSSLFRPHVYTTRTEEARSYTLADFLGRVGVMHCDLMKVDIEGAEYEVFMGASPVLTSGVLKNIALEFHNSIMEKRGVSPARLHELMIDSGYTLNAELGPLVYSFAG
jgi:FkbM family methyltransferase